MNQPAILLNVTDGVAEITLNRPDKLNSFTRSMHAELRAALDAALGDDRVRALMLTGAGRGFCAGQDLEDIIDPASGQPGSPAATLAEDYNPLIRRLQTCSIPVVCAINGIAAGAGANLALACDIVIAARSASFLQAFAKIGLVPDAGGSFFLPRLVGTARALGLAMLAERLPAETAAQWGLIWEVVDDAMLMERARTLCRQLASAPTVALGLIKREIRASFDNDLAAQLDLEAECQQIAASTSDYREGVAAFLAKRKPNFGGR
jgi:2-(1,2-epoxy-1,2-dihydrophenyl)acetyl-CoA isomerase